MNKRNRRSIRLKGWDYRTPGFYFVTICTHKRYPFFSDPTLHDIAADSWAYIPNLPHAAHVRLDRSVVMPDHFHGLIEILALDSFPTKPATLSTLIGNYKMRVTKRVRAMQKATGTSYPVWQRGFWERIVRNERELEAVRRYIEQNPIRWQEKRDNLDQLLPKMNQR